MKNKSSICGTFRYCTSADKWPLLVNECHQIYMMNGRCQTRANSLGSSDNVFEAVGGITRQPHTLAATAQVLTVRPLHINVSLLLLTATAGLRATLGQKILGSKWRQQKKKYLS